MPSSARRCTTSPGEGLPFRGATFRRSARCRGIGGSGSPLLRLATAGELVICITSLCSVSAMRSKKHGVRNGIYRVLLGSLRGRGEAVHGLLSRGRHGARNSAKKNFGEGREAFDRGSRTAGAKGNSRGTENGNSLEPAPLLGFVLSISLYSPCSPVLER